MGFSGRLEGIAPSDIFQIINQNRMTGTLIARCQEGTAMVVFQSGQIIEAASDTPQESLGSLLVSQGIVVQSTIDSAEQRMKKLTDQTLGTILVDREAISAKTLETVVLKQIELIVHRLVSCEDGFITFDRGETAVKRKLNTREFLFPSGVSTQYLMMERARVIDEERRRVADRRAHPREPLQESDPPQQVVQPVTKPAEYGAAPNRLVSWFRGIRFAVIDSLRSAAMSASDRVHGMIKPGLEKALGKVRAFSPDGRAMVLAGIAGIAAGIGLMLLFSTSVGTTGGDLLITGKLVKLRARPTTSAAVVVKIPQGEMVTPLESRDGWHQVRTRAGETGWVWKSLVRQQEMKKDWTFRYRVTGFEIILAAGVMLLIFGIRRKSRSRRLLHASCAR